MAVTLKDISRMAGVSIGTVSTVLNNSTSSARIGEETRRRVLDVAKKLHYEPNLFGKSLKMSKSFTFGVLTGHISGSFIPELLSGIENFFMDKGLTMLLSTYRNEEDFVKKILQHKERRVEGEIIISGRPKLEELLADHMADIPLVMTGYEPTRSHSASVLVNPFTLGYQAAKHLLKLGHRKIAFLDFHDEKRIEGYKAALAEENVQFQEDWIIPGSNEFKDGEKVFKRLLAIPEHPHALIAHNDVLAVGVINVAFQMGFSVPEDYSVMGIDGGDAAIMCRPPLTTIDQPRFEQGTAAADLLYKLIEGQSPKNVSLIPTLIARKSCAMSL